MRARILASGLFASLALATVATAPLAAKSTSDITAAVADPHRTEAERHRDPYRHPVQTLEFFGVRADQTLVEFNPGGGWYTAILAPMLAPHGHYIGLVVHGEKSEASLAKLIAAGGDRYHGATAATLDPATGSSTVPDNSADVVVTFRNVHNLIFAGGTTPDGAFKAFYRMLKPGGVLGVVDHHLPETMDSALEKKSGYLKRSTVIRLAEAAGFKLAGETAINANPADTHDWPEGVWTLPPVLQLGDKDKAKYLAIGESDRMTLKFVKPR
ncbi:class I SAM-dependent methyltransferase [Novosphingobium acidiphilum]|uniref:class I SAM-dependent methyltransferase n=1 Tax=Novosphingobium acidiphilum TaxID=505248 RepID=UPI0004188D81|nr:methyltransferase domain-containing protein [Novosphingobium acidiphilum]